MNKHSGSGASRHAGAVLWALFLLDTALALVGFFFPGLWFSVFHGAPYSDPFGLLRRCAANWAAFAAIEALALFRFRREPYWLAVVAGLRLGDVATDWAYLAFASTVTSFGKLALGMASPSNLAAGLFFLRAFKSLAKNPISD